MDEALRRTSYLRQPTEINPNDEYDLDKWYWSKTGTLDIKAAKVMGLSIEGLPDRISKRKSPPKTVDLAVPCEAIREECTLDEFHWNWPKLITEFEILNKCRLTKASVEAAINNNRISVPTNITLESILGDETIEQWYRKYVKHIWNEPLLNSSNWSLSNPAYKNYSPKQRNALEKIAPYLGQISEKHQGEQLDGKDVYKFEFYNSEETTANTNGATYILSMKAPCGPSELEEEDIVLTNKMKKALKNLQPRHFTVYKGERYTNYLLIAFEMYKMFGTFPSKKTLMEANLSRSQS